MYKYTDDMKIDKLGASIKNVLLICENCVSQQFNHKGNKKSPVKKLLEYMSKKIKPVKYLEKYTLD